ncbi:MAG: magnesium transporter [Defluviitaleaceae bacterium]|nr:magnesium transporter [Defluviitaleaceae bacterium]
MLSEKLLTCVDSKNLENMLKNSEEMEILQAFYHIPPSEQIKVFNQLSNDSAFFVFERLDTEYQLNLVEYFSDEKAFKYLNEMAPDDRVRLFDEMPASVAKKFLNSLSHEEREVTNVLMGYEEKTAGRIMTTKFISLSRDMTVSQAYEKIRNQATDKESVYNLYVTDSTKKLEGVLSLKNLIQAEEGKKIEEIMRSRPIFVETNTRQIDVARTLKQLDLLAVPVVDTENRIVGIVTIDDAVDTLETEATETSLKLVGITGEADRSDVLINGKTTRIWRTRLPVLLVTLAFGFVAAFIMDGFEETLEAMIGVAIFIPLIMGMSGDVGTQSSTVFARGVALGHINIKRFARYLLKETWVGFTMGIVVGAGTGVIASVWFGMPMLGVAVGVAIALTMTLAALLGFLVPWALIKLNLDQAAGSAPIITSLKDISGLLVYFVLVSVLLGNLM